MAWWWRALRLLWLVLTVCSCGGRGRDVLAVAATGEASNATGVDGDQTDNSARYSGAVYVFNRSGGVWAQTAYVKASNTEQSDSFGQGVALSGDTLAVGAVDERSNATGVDGDQTDNSAPSSGAAYVFSFEF